MAEPQKRKALESPSIDGREVCTKHTAKVEGMKHITKEQYLRLVDDRVAIPLRLQVEDASEGDLMNHPCGIDLYTGLHFSGWVQAMQSFLRNSLTSLTLGHTASSDNVVLDIEESQESLAVVVQALYTGELELNSQNIESRLFIADYLQIPVLVDSMMHFISHHLVQESPAQVCHLHERFHLLRNSRGWSVLECVCRQLTKSLHPTSFNDPEQYMVAWHQISKTINEGDEGFAKSIFQRLGQFAMCFSQIMDLYLSFVFQDYKIIEDCEWYMNFHRGFFLGKEEAEFLLNNLTLWKARELRPSQAKILLDLYDFLSKTVLKSRQIEMLGLLILPQTCFRQREGSYSKLMCPIEGLSSSSNELKALNGCCNVELAFTCNETSGVWTMSVESVNYSGPDPFWPGGAKMLVFYFLKRIASSDSSQNKSFGMDSHSVGVQNLECSEDIAITGNEYVMRNHLDYFHQIGGKDTMLAFATLICEMQ